MVAMIFRLYLDESEDRQGEIFAVGGFAGKDDQWNRLEPRWLAALPEGIGYFHATDCFVGKHPFAPDNGFDIPRRMALLDNLTDLICEMDVKLICHGIDVPTYKVFAPKRKVNEFLGNKYVAPFEAAIETCCRDYMQPPGVHEPVETGDFCALFFEDNDFANTAIEDLKRMRRDELLWWRDRIGDGKVGTKEGPTAIPLLQVADLGAFLGGKVIGKAQSGTIPWMPYYEKLNSAGRVIRPSKIDKHSLQLLYGLKGEMERQRANGTSYWDDIP
jgi:hypothetical protein